jgi:hypothetical protein
MARLIELTQPDGSPALVNPDGVTLVITPSASLGFPQAARSVVFMGTQTLAVTETVAQVQARLVAAHPARGRKAS